MTEPLGAGVFVQLGFDAAEAENLTQISQALIQLAGFSRELRALHRLLGNIEFDPEHALLRIQAAPEILKPGQLFEVEILMPCGAKPARFCANFVAAVASQHAEVAPSRLRPLTRAGLQKLIKKARKEQA